MAAVWSVGRMIDATHDFKRMLERAETGIRYELTAESLTDADRKFYGDVWECLNALKFMIRFESNLQVHELKTHSDNLRNVKDNETD